MSANKEIVQKINDAFSEGNTEAFLAYCTEDIRWDMLGHPPVAGQDAMRKAMTMTEYEPPVIRVSRMIAEGDMVSCEGTVTMKKKNGEPHEAAFCDVYQFSNGKVQTMTTYAVDLPSATNNESK